MQSLPYEECHLFYINQTKKRTLTIKKTKSCHHRKFHVKVALIIWMMVLSEKIIG